MLSQGGIIVRAFVSHLEFIRPSTFNLVRKDTSILPATSNEDEKDEGVKRKEEKSFFAKIFPGSSESMNSQIIQEETGGLIANSIPPHPSGFIHYDPHISVEEVMTAIKESPGYLKGEVKKFIKEELNHSDATWNLYNKVQCVRQILGPRHGETMVDYEFKSDEDMGKWKTGCDSVWSQGYSKCQFYLTDKNTAVFEGNLSSKLVKDGRTLRAGWCGIKSVDQLAFDRTRYYEHWREFSHLIIKCRGDGRSYKVLLHTPMYWDVTWGDNYSYPLHTHGGPYWQYEKIPFSRFFKTYSGRIQDRQEVLVETTVSSIGITLMDRIDGPFKFELGFIGVTRDKTHKEEFAYETYSMKPTVV